MTLYGSGVKLVYLPPYSPDLNPIEEFFSWMKAWIRRHGQRFRDIVEEGEDADAIMFLYYCLDNLDVRDASGWFHHSGYV